MGKYIENHLNKNETMVKAAEMHPISLVISWIGGIAFCWLLFIPTIKAIIATLRYFNTELGMTNKRVIGKVGVINTKSLDAPLNKIQNISASSGLFGKIFGYGNLEIHTALGVYSFDKIKNPDALKGAFMAQIDQYEEDRVKAQAQEMASAMANSLK